MLEVDIEATVGGFSLAAQFAIPNGATALIGPSGAGKTTLLRMIAGLAKPSRGRIGLGGKTLFDAASPIGVPTHRRRIGMVFQEPRLLPHLNVHANIALGAANAGATRIRGVAERLHLGALLPRRIGGLSGGEQQRVMLARALVGDPELILCDEPLTGLDAPLKAILLEAMRTLFAGANVPILYVTHSIDEAVRLSDNFLVMREGKITDRGEAGAVLSRLGDDLSFESGASSLLTGTVAAIDQTYALARIAVGRQFVEVQAGTLKVGDPARLRLWAKDIMLALRLPEAISARNALAATVASIRPVGDAQAEVTVMLEEIPVRTRLMRKTVAELGLS
ncbi:MAG: molybdenum ABC transporter ATP-binding protein, partial [Cucumibacter sp.]